MEVNESNSKWAFPSILRSIPNFLKRKSSLLRKVQRTCLRGLPLRECFSRRCIPPWRWLHEFVNWGDNIDSLWKKKCCLYTGSLTTKALLEKRWGGGKEEEEREKEKRKEKQQFRAQFNIQIREGKNHFFPWSTSLASSQMPVEKVLGWNTNQEPYHRIRESWWWWEITYIQVVRKIIDFFAGGAGIWNYFQHHPSGNLGMEKGTNRPSKSSAFDWWKSRCGLWHSGGIRVK